MTLKPFSLNRSCRATAWVSLALIGSSLLAPASFAQDKVVRLSNRTEVAFSSVEKGKQLIGKIDDYVSRTSELERQMRLQTNDPVSTEAFVESMQKGVREWNAEEVDTLTAIINELKPTFTEYGLPLPPRIELIRVVAAVEANMPHCRGASIVIPDRFFTKNAPRKTIFTHELFHVLSSHNPTLRDKLYEIIGFVPCNEISLPDSLADRQLTNPDAPVNRHRIELTGGDGNTFSAVPIIHPQRGPLHERHVCATHELSIDGAGKGRGGQLVSQSNRWQTGNAGGLPSPRLRKEDRSQHTLRDSPRRNTRRQLLDVDAEAEATSRSMGGRKNESGSEG